MTKGEQNEVEFEGMKKIVYGMENDVSSKLG